eukprot:7523987-Pyramimonas_sp.AAC.1
MWALVRAYHERLALLADTLLALEKLRQQGDEENFARQHEALIRHDRSTISLCEEFELLQELNAESDNALLDAFGNSPPRPWRPDAPRLCDEKPACDEKPCCAMPDFCSIILQYGAKHALEYYNTVQSTSVLPVKDE